MQLLRIRPQIIYYESSSPLPLIEDSRELQVELIEVRVNCLNIFILLNKNIDQNLSIKEWSLWTEAHVKSKIYT